MSNVTIKEYIKNYRAKTKSADRVVSKDENKSSALKQPQNQPQKIQSQIHISSNSNNVNTNNPKNRNDEIPEPIIDKRSSTINNITVNKLISNKKPIPSQSNHIEIEGEIQLSQENKNSNIKINQNINEKSGLKINNRNIKQNNVNVINQTTNKDKTVNMDSNFNYKKLLVNKAKMINSQSTRPKKNPTKLPRKSPIPLPRGFQSKNYLNKNKFSNFSTNINLSNGLYNFNNLNFNLIHNQFSSNNPLSLSTQKGNSIINTIYKTTGNNLKKNKKDRSVSPLLNKNFKENKVSPSIFKPKHVSKSPNLTKSTFLNTFRNIHSANFNSTKESSTKNTSKSPSLNKGFANHNHINLIKDNKFSNVGNISNKIKHQTKQVYVSESVSQHLINNNSHNNCSTGTNLMNKGINCDCDDQGEVKNIVNNKTNPNNHINKNPNNSVEGKKILQGNPVLKNRYISSPYSEIKKRILNSKSQERAKTKSKEKIAPTQLNTSKKQTSINENKSASLSNNINIEAVLSKDKKENENSITTKNSNNLINNSSNISSFKKSEDTPPQSPNKKNNTINNMYNVPINSNTKISSHIDIPSQIDPSQNLDSNHSNNNLSLEQNQKTSSDDQIISNNNDNDSFLNIIDNKDDEEDETSNTRKNNNPQCKEQIIKKIKSIHEYTHVGFDGESDKEHNQDISFVFKSFAGKEDYVYMSVCDGHGVEGHEVSSYVKRILPYFLSENLKNIDLIKDTDTTHKIIKGTFIFVNDKLVDNDDINSDFSGSTCVSVIFTPEKLICPNIGDSRAVIGRCIKKNGKEEWVSQDLTRDHKPTEKDEAKRIKENGGRIQPFIDEGEFLGPDRVWIMEDDIPGLAMTRSFGDRVAATVGVMSEPEIKEYKFNKDDKFIVIASDGIWEFIESLECVNMIKDFYIKNDLVGCCNFLYEESKSRWLKEEEVIDDITIILVFLE